MCFPLTGGSSAKQYHTNDIHNETSKKFGNYLHYILQIIANACYFLSKYEGL